MDFIVGVHIGADWPNGINCAKVSLLDTDIQHIFLLAARIKKGETISDWDCRPDLGWSELDLDTADDTSYRNLHEAELVLMDEAHVFKSNETSSDPVHSEVVQLHVDKTDFWWEGTFKHTNTHWETRMIPLTWLPQELRPASRKVQSVSKAQSGSLPDLEMTEEAITLIENTIAKGMSHGLNAREIEATLHRKITKAQLTRVVMHLIDQWSSL